jgi:hypothetical protein
MQTSGLDEIIANINILAWPNLLWNVNLNCIYSHHFRLTFLRSVSAWTWSATLLQSSTAAYSWGALFSASKQWLIVNDCYFQA